MPDTQKALKKHNYTVLVSQNPERASLRAQMAKNLPAMQETQVRFLGWEDPLEKEMATHSSIPFFFLIYLFDCKGSWLQYVRSSFLTRNHTPNLCIEHRVLAIGRPGKPPTPVFLPGESHGQRSLEGLQSLGWQGGGHNWEANTQHTQNHESILQIPDFPLIFFIFYLKETTRCSW